MALLLVSSIVACAAPIRFDLASTDGARYSSSRLGDSSATVLVFLATDCPISNRYSPLLHQMEIQYRAARVRFLAVFSEAAISAQSAKKHLAEFGLEMPGLIDPTASLARQSGARVTPEVVVLSPAGSVLYRGRIDDRYVDWGKTREAPTEHDLRDSLDSVLAGKAVARPVTKALGCAIAGVS